MKANITRRQREKRSVSRILHYNSDAIFGVNECALDFLFIDSETKKLYLKEVLAVFQVFEIMDVRVTVCGAISVKKFKVLFELFHTATMSDLNEDGGRDTAEALKFCRQETENDSLIV